ncbi:MAG: U32 family peptidase, partial [Rikenellaceae bacterium]|nr:U32 family peptidase [Rikenellaceae bacterium]
MLKRTDIEIMAPVGSWESLAAALDGGADAVYFGAGGLNMRARSSVNFSLDDLGRIVAATRARGVKSYLTVNTILYDEDVAQMRAIVDRAAAEGVDAIIAADQAAITYAADRGVEVHISTQLNLSNTEAVRFYAQWADVVVLARELNLEQIAAIHNNVERENICGPSGKPVKIEMFAHGALC